MLESDLRKSDNGHDKVDHDKDDVRIELDQQAEIDRINELRERDHDEAIELDHFQVEQSPIDLEEELEESVEHVEDVMEWLEIGSSAIGGGVPIVEVGSVEDAIDKVLEEEFDVEDMMHDSIEELQQKELDSRSLMEDSMSSSGPEMNFKKGGK